MASPHQIFIHSPELGLRSRSITISPSAAPDDTLLDLKHSLFPPSFPLLTSVFFSLSGKPLPDSTLMSSLRPLSTLLIRIRLPGGGGDGGATGAESRDCYLNMYASKKPDKADPNETRLSRWTTCALSSEPLKAPIVIDRLGNLFNKETLIQALINKRIPKEFSHIRGLKDMIPVDLAENPDGKTELKFHCPITGLEFNGKYPFFAIRGCGHVISTKALKEVKLKSLCCLVCHKEFNEANKIAINGSEEEVKILRERMEAERGKVKGDKKEKKVSGIKHAIAEVNGVENGVKKLKNESIMVPQNATKEVYASIFTSSKKKSGFKETYSCRSLPLGRN